MGNVSSALLSFSGNTFLSGLLEVGKSVLGFLAGGDSPIAEVMKLAEKSDELTKGADAISKIGDGLDKMGKLKFDGSDINLSAFAEDLVKSVPLIEKAIMGGTVEASFLEGLKFWGGGDDLIFKGLASGDINYEEAVKNIRMLRTALGSEVADVNTTPPSGEVPQTVSSAALGRAGAAAQAQRVAAINTNNVVSSPTTNYVNNGISSRRPISLGNVSQAAGWRGL